MKNLKQTISAIVTTVILLTASKGFAQEDMNHVLSNFTPDAVQTTFQPLADAMSADLNSGLFHSAKVDKSFNIYLGVKVFGTTMTTEEEKWLSGAPMGVIPYATPQLTIGSVFGTDITVRYLPTIKIGSYGSVSSFGFAVRHSVSRYFKNSPIDMSVQFGIQSMKIADSKSKDVVSTSSTAANLQFSKELAGFFTIYTGIQYENTKINVNYNYNNLAQVNANFENSSKIKGIVGINLGMGPININGDINFGKRTTYSVGFGIGF